MAIGDWGGQENSPYTTNSQLVTAHGLGEIAAQLDAHFIVGLGDNFYTNGAVDVALFAYFGDSADVAKQNADVAGIATDVADFRFKTVYEDVYTAPSLFVPWCVHSLCCLFVRAYRAIVVALDFVLQHYSRIYVSELWCWR